MLFRIIGLNPKGRILELKASIEKIATRRMRPMLITSKE